MTDGTRSFIEKWSAKRALPRNNYIREEFEKLEHNIKSAMEDEDEKILLLKKGIYQWLLKHKRIEGARWIVIEHYFFNKNISAAAKKFKVSRSAIHKWLRQFEEEDNILPQKRGRPAVIQCRLTKDQLTELRNIIINKMPIDFSLNYAAWSNKVVRKLIFQLYGFDISLRCVTRLLVSFGFLPKKVDYTWLIVRYFYEGMNLTLREVAKDKKAQACFLVIEESYLSPIIVMYLMTARRHIDFCCVHWDRTTKRCNHHFRGVYFKQRREVIIDFLKKIKRSKHKKLVVCYDRENLQTTIISTVESVEHALPKGISLVPTPIVKDPGRLRFNGHYYPRNIHGGYLYLTL